VELLRVSGAALLGAGFLVFGVWRLIGTRRLAAVLAQDGGFSRTGVRLLITKSYAWVCLDFVIAVIWVLLPFGFGRPVGLALAGLLGRILLVDTLLGLSPTFRRLRKNERFRGLRREHKALVS
jgi:hypothetical protein